MKTLNNWKLIGTSSDFSINNVWFVVWQSKKSDISVNCTNINYFQCETSIIHVQMIVGFEAVVLTWTIHTIHRYIGVKKSNVFLRKIYVFL